MTIDEFFSGRPLSRSLFDALVDAMTGVGQAEVRVSKSQVAFWRKSAFAWAWVPDMYLSGHHAPLVLSLSLRRRDRSPRWKEVVGPTPGRFMHHLELHDESDVDPQVSAWLQEAWSLAG